MHDAQNPIIFSLFLIFTGAALFATLALYARQALPIAYIVLGIFIGPYGIQLINNASAIDEMAQIGIMFLLFLLGLDLSPQRLLQMLRKATLITLSTSLIFASMGAWVAWLFGYTTGESLLVGMAMMFSSTIIGLKLLPTRTLHHQHTGEIIISILLLQDLLAITVLLLIEGLGGRGSSLRGLGLLIVTLPLLLGFAWLASRYVLIPLIRRFDKIREYIFLTAIGWCLCVSQVAALLGLSYAIGAFIGGVSLATSPIALYIAESLRPLRDFFLVLFFFSLGASFDLGMLGAVFFPTLLLGALLLVAKPWVFRGFLQWAGERGRIAMEVGVRLGQVSEFALLIAVLAEKNQLIGREASYLVQATTLLTFIASTYYLVLRYPTPVAVSDSLRRD
ncbi:MAG TPA: cation:proton antiporter [Candidatus Competibacteraceae bacterium]|nr:MAG: cation:proton antiporter [Candidatus Competibacteraceae bacterium]HOB60969.1 cation:proton antiporter [Candidatus Competibacteraceae bacterium]HQA27149.1 cation:proton antiporter [Candidatus Competibacteraceae bacterium]HQD57660.1 cation:proton antiporter [Candidatus Competibacteraceae bacterium]